MAQLVEHVLGKDEVTGSSPVSSSILNDATTRRFFIKTAIADVCQYIGIIKGILTL